MPVGRLHYAKMFKEPQIYTVQIEAPNERRLSNPGVGRIKVLGDWVPDQMGIRDPSKPAKSERPMSC